MICKSAPKIQKFIPFYIMTVYYYYRLRRTQSEALLATPRQVTAVQRSASDVDDQKTPATPSFPKQGTASRGRPKDSIKPYSDQSPTTKANTFDDFRNLCEEFAETHGGGDLPGLLADLLSSLVQPPPPDPEHKHTKAISNVFSELDRCYRSEPLSTQKPQFSALAASSGLTRSEVETLGFPLRRDGMLTNLK
jgi:hypothetical protein